MPLGDVRLQVRTETLTMENIELKDEGCGCEVCECDGCDCGDCKCDPCSCSNGCGCE